MQVDLELRLIHDGTHWVVSNNLLQAKGSTFVDLDTDLKNTLLDLKQFPAGKKVKVFMGFDFDTLPTWLRQYHNHYFNRFTDIQL